MTGLFQLDSRLMEEDDDEGVRASGACLSFDDFARNCGEGGGEASMEPEAWHDPLPSALTPSTDNVSSDCLTMQRSTRTRSAASDDVLSACPTRTTSAASATSTEDALPALLEAGSESTRRSPASTEIMYAKMSKIYRKEDIQYQRVMLQFIDDLESEGKATQHELDRASWYRFKAGDRQRTREKRAVEKSGATWKGQKQNRRIVAAKNAGDNVQNALAECAICTEVGVCVAFVPCGHICLCERCSTKQVYPKCIICSHPGVSLMKVWHV
jgi:hypothetical protein